MPDLSDLLLIVIRGLLLMWLLGAAIIFVENLCLRQVTSGREFWMDVAVGTVFALFMGWLN